MEKKAEPDVAALLDGPAQGKFDFIEGDGYSFEFVCVTRQGYELFRRKEGHGGYSYWSSEVAPAVLIWDEGTSNIMSVFEALDHLGEGEVLWKHIGVVFGYTQD